VNLRVACEHYGYRPERVIEMRAEGRPFTAIYGQVIVERKGHGKGKTVIYEERGRGAGQVEVREDKGRGKDKGDKGHGKGKGKGKDKGKKHGDDDDRD
jgi:hypothetical protein